MATSLAEQLQRLAVPQTSLLKRDKKRASLLFDPKEAAGIKRETFYQIGLEGLEELIEKNAQFKQFRETLFGVLSKDFERSVQNTDANKLLDRNIKRFLLILSPYFLINSSHKALEWLIHRYMIQDYNREDLLKLILPFHESNIFVRALQLLQFKDSNDTWYFLKALQKPGLHLTKNALLNQAATNSYILKFVGKYIQELIKEHNKPQLLAVSFNFYCVVYMGAIEYSTNIREDQLSQMLPFLLKGLASDIPDYCAASYLIVARLVAKSTLSNKMLDALVEKISKLNNSSLKTESCLVLLVLYQSQDWYKKVPDAALQNFLENRVWLMKELHTLDTNGSYIYPFLERLVSNSFAKCMMSNDNGEIKELINQILADLKLDDFFVGTFLYALLDSLPKTFKISEGLKNWLTEIVQTLERQYPTQFDKTVYKIMASDHEPAMKKRKKMLHKVLKNTMTYKGKFELIENMCHANEECRTQAIEQLKNNFDNFNDTDKEIIKNLLIERLNADNPKVIKKTLDVIAIKRSIFDEVVLRDVLFTLVKKCKTGKLEKITETVLTMLISLPESSKDWLTFMALFPYLITNSQEEFDKYLPILSEYIKNHEILKRTQNLLLSSKDPNEFAKIVIKTLQNSNDMHYTWKLINTLSGVPTEKRDTLHKYIASVIITNILSKQSSIDTCKLILEILYTYFKSTDKVCNKNTSIADNILVCFQNKLPIDGFIDCVENIAYKTAVPPNLGALNFFNVEANEYFIFLFKIIMANEKDQSIAMRILEHFCKTLQEKLEFILNVCSSDHSLLSDESLITGLKVIISLLEKDAGENMQSFNNINVLIVPFLLTLLSSPENDIRKLSCTIVNILHQPQQKKSESFLPLLEGLHRQIEEIELDNEQLPLIVFKILAPENTKGKKLVRELNIIRKKLIAIVCDDAKYPLYLQSGLLTVLSHINGIEMFEEIANKAIVILKKELIVLNKHESIIVENSLLKIEQNIADKITCGTKIWELIEVALKDEKTVVTCKEKNLCPTLLVLNQLEKEIFSHLKEDVTKNLLKLLTEISTFGQNPEILPASSRIFKHIDLDVKHILDLLVSMKEVQSPKLDESKKKRRLSVVPTIDILDTPEWKKGTTVLEFLQDKKKIRNSNMLLPILFDILKKCLDFDEQSSVEYPKQLLLSLILHCCTKIEETLPENVFNMELIVQCIRASQNPQTHHHALLVLACTAQLIPTQVLHHIMAIFTFMGSSVLRHDDAYSFQIITKIIDTIIPILVKDSDEVNISKVLRVFVDAILDVPEHRRLPLYKQLLERINAKENLYLFLLLIFESHVCHNCPEKQGFSIKGIDTTPRRLDIAANLAREFPPEIVILSCIKLIKYLKELPEEKDDKMDSDEVCATFDISTHTPKQFRHYKYTLLTFTSNLLASNEFVNKIALLSDKDLLNLESLYKESIIHILTYVQRISKVADKNINTPQAQYWKVVLHHSYDILDSINALLTPQMFLLVFKGLMVHNISTVRRRALELLNTKLQYNTSYFTECDVNEIYALIPAILAILESLESNIEPEQELIVQTALLSLKLISKSLATQDPERFVTILDYITVLVKSVKASPNVQASIVLCLAELIANLRAHAISNLHSFMPALIKILKHQKSQETPTLLLLSVITAVDKVLDSLPLFLSPYLEKLLFELSILMCHWGSSTEEQKLQPKLLSIRQKIGSVIPSRVLIPAIEKCYDNLIEKRQFKAISSLMDILGENMTNLKGPEINSNLQELTAFFLNALQFRSNGNCSLSEANEIEGHIIKSFTILILKLSEGNFRPLYYKLFDWATRAEVKSERVITFYGLSSGISQSLKGLFVLFAGHFLNNSAQILEACNKIKNDDLYYDDDDKNMLLLTNVLQTLHSVFLYDNQKFINKDRFEVLMQPIVNQLENTLGGMQSLIKRNKEILTPCIVNFALATADDSLWKQMNYQVLLKMRHTDSDVRLVALHCLTELVKKLGEDFLPLLPETIPFLAELLEDEDEIVEKSCKKAVQEMEKVLGEPLQKYF
ncbi:unnamed protein product [Brassicogethes aeneus]|uniref:HEAT repeat-containing protein 1 n=1 Tax=Brassicogethes aeneus TaxID=1431903 RepID=A0A9P0FJP4_BRAAE|nr:unnamed protein product [Brassicogethes aeneus]